MKKVLLIALAFVLSSCVKTKTYKDKLQVHHENLEPQEIVVKKYNEALFSIDTADFAEGLKSIKDDYMVFLGGDLDNADAVAYLKAFAVDTFCIRLNDLVEKKFSDDKALRKEIKSVYQRMNYYYPGIMIPETYFYVSGVDYEIPAIMIQPDAVLISLDYYLGNDDGIYDYIGMPRYRSLRCQPSYITRDLAQAFYDNMYARRAAKKDVLSEMINVGKQLYFIEAMNPALPDSVLFGYSSQQTQWAQQYEADVWAAIVGNNMLYANDMMAFRNFFGDAPFTQAFSRESAPRLGEYIGLQIIRSYMTHNDVSLQELMKNNDLQQIFQNSQYKPFKS
ncbi:MAG: hypothetical protein IKV80_10380 [Bacteroidales bacterium]|nr:hypothetical protein [Bacteroidales bacterium]